MTENRQAYIIPPLMDLPPFSNTINPWQLAAEKGRLVGEIALAALPRLAVLNHADGKAAVALAAGVDENGVHYIKAEIQADIDLDCQRCLGSLRLPVTVTVALGLIRSEAEAERLLERYEPLLVADGDVAVADLVEDELLLALPKSPVMKSRGNARPTVTQRLTKQGPARTIANPSRPWRPYCLI